MVKRIFSGGTVGVFYIHTDHLNAPSKITRPSDNQIIWRWDHDPFGNGAPNEDPDGNGQLLTFNLRFPGQNYDNETGIVQNGYRDYDSNTGRYVESDPIGLAGGQFSTYAYVGGNPLTFADPTGRCPACAALGFAAGAIGYAAGTWMMGSDFNTGDMLWAGLGGAFAGATFGWGEAAVDVSMTVGTAKTLIGTGGEMAFDAAMSLRDVAGVLTGGQNGNSPSASSPSQTTSSDGSCP